MTAAGRAKVAPLKQVLPDSLSDDLYRYLVDHMYAVEPERRRRSVWIMNGEWRDECLKISGPVPAATTMLGLPFIIRDDGGVPHLELMD